MLHLGIAPETMQILTNATSIDDVRTALAHGLPCIVTETGEELGRIPAADAISGFERYLNDCVGLGF